MIWRRTESESGCWNFRRWEKSRCWRIRSGISACRIHRSFYTNSGKWARFCRSTKEACFEDLEKRRSGQQGFYWKTALRAVWQAMPTELDYRTTDMRPVRQFLEERYGEAYAQLLLKVNPRRILEDRQIFYEPSPERKRKRRWFL